MKRKSIIIALAIILLIALVCIVLLSINNREKIANVFSNSKKQEIENGISYHVYEYKDNVGMMLVRIKNSENGIEKITRPDGTIINCYGKKQISIDQKIEKNGSYQFIAKTVSGETLDETITMDDETIEKLMEVTYTEENTNLSININYDDYKNKYYRFSQDEEWTKYTGNFDILVENAANELNYDEENHAITIYLKGTDDLDHEVLTQTKIAINAELPKTNLIITTANGNNLDTSKIQRDIKNKLAQNNISAAFMGMSLGETQYVDSASQDAQTIFNTWGRIGYKGQWSYNPSTKTIINAENTDNFTGFYYPGNVYKDIELSYNNRTTDWDDDMMGAMIRFNKNADGTVTTYVFALDRHDNGGGIGNGAYNGLLKITNKGFALGNVQVLQKVDKVWTRNTWSNYKLVAKDNNIKVYMNGELIIDYTDTNSPILTGSYGFFSCSQAQSQYKDIVGKGFKAYTLAEAIEKTNWDKPTRYIVNINDSQQEQLTDELVRSPK